MALVPLSYNLRSLRVRKSATLLTVISVGATVAIFAGVLALQQGFETIFTESGRDDVAVFLRPGAISEGESGFPRDKTEVLKKSLPELAVVDEHMSCAREHTSHECHGHQQPRDRGVRMGLVRGSVPDGRRRPRGCRWPDRPTGGPWPSACARSGRSRAPWPRPSAVWAGANYAPAQTAVFASLWPPPARAWGVTWSNGQSDSGR